MREEEHTEDQEEIPAVLKGWGVTKEQWLKIVKNTVAILAVVGAYAQGQFNRGDTETAQANATKATQSAARARTEAQAAQTKATESRKKLNDGWSQLAPAFNSLLKATQDLSKNQGRIMGVLEARGLLRGGSAPTMEVLPAKPKPAAPVVAVTPSRAPASAPDAGAAAPPRVAAAPPKPEPRAAPRPRRRPTPRKGTKRYRPRAPVMAVMSDTPPPRVRRHRPRRQTRKPDAGPPKPDQRVIKIRKLPERLNQQMQQQIPPGS